jgi:hypothetical protein
MIASDIQEIPQATPVQKEMQDLKTEIPKKEEKQEQKQEKKQKYYYSWFTRAIVLTGVAILLTITLPFIILGMFIKTSFML